MAVDAAGNLATATSTGGLVNKMPGRIGDPPLVGAGTYANALCAVSATGVGRGDHPPHCCVREGGQHSCGTLAGASAGAAERPGTHADRIHIYVRAAYVQTISKGSRVVADANGSFAAAATERHGGVQQDGGAVPEDEPAAAGPAQQFVETVSCEHAAALVHPFVCLIENPISSSPSPSPSIASVQIFFPLLLW